MEHILGAVLAGGRSRRFGSDKALAELNGASLLSRAVQALAAQTGAVIVVGHGYTGAVAIEDRPGPGLGPLGGLNAALRYAEANGFAAVLSAPVDVIPLPPDLVARLEPRMPAVWALQHVVGCWPADLADELDRHLASGQRSVHSWIDRIGAERVALNAEAININSVSDFNHVEARLKDR